MADSSSVNSYGPGARRLARASLILGWLTCFLWLLGCIPILLLHGVPHTRSAITIQILWIVVPYVILGGVAITFGVIARRGLPDAAFDFDRSRRRALQGIVTGSLGAIVAIPAFFVLRTSGRWGLKLWSVKRLKNLALAAHDYHSAFEYIPLAIYDQNKKPLLSWRVALLPYFGQERLYAEFRLNEPWDSPHNSTLLPRMPGLLASGGWPADDIARTGMTRFKVFVGEGAPFARGRRMTLGVLAVCDGSSNTMFIAEAGDPVPWTKPEDFTYDPNGPLPNLDSHHEEGFYFAAFDGSVHLLKKGAPEAVIRSLITYDGGETLPIAPWLD